MTSSNKRRLGGRHRRWLVGAALVGVGWLVTPNAVPVYDGVGVPDEPYRYVAPPKGTATTAEPTRAEQRSPVKRGVSVNGMSVSTGEVGPQFSLFLPPGSVAGADGTLVVTAEPAAPAAPPPGKRMDGNQYHVTLVDGAAPVTLTPQAAIATLYMRATTARQPGPDILYRPDPTAAWEALKTSRGGQDIYVAGFRGPGDYALAFVATDSEQGASRRPLLLVGAGLLLVLAVVVVRLRSTGDAAQDPRARRPAPGRMSRS